MKKTPYAIDMLTAVLGDATFGPNVASGWGAGDVPFFRPLYDQVVANYCADKARVFAELRRKLTKEDQLLVFLIGHGTTADGEDAKFNLVGPDLSATEWADLLKPIPGRLVFVNTTSASFPFLRKLAARGRVVMTATDSSAQQFETVFPEFFLKAFEDGGADLDKSGRVSLWEAFTYASAGVRGWFEQKGQLPTERPLLDDTGAGVGREAQNAGVDGAVARVTYLALDAVLALPSDAIQAALVKRRADLERDASSQFRNPS